MLEEFRYALRCSLLRQSTGKSSDDFAPSARLRSLIRKPTRQKYEPHQNDVHTLNRYMCEGQSNSICKQSDIDTDKEVITSALLINFLKIVIQKFYVGGIYVNFMSIY